MSCQCVTKQKLQNSEFHKETLRRYQPWKRLIVVHCCQNLASYQAKQQLQSTKQQLQKSEFPSLDQSRGMPLSLCQHDPTILPYSYSLASPAATVFAIYNLTCLPRLFEGRSQCNNEYFSNSLIDGCKGSTIIFSRQYFKCGPLKIASMQFESYL